MTHRTFSMGRSTGVEVGVTFPYVYRSVVLNKKSSTWVIFRVHLEPLLVPQDPRINGSFLVPLCPVSLVRENVSRVFTPQSRSRRDRVQIPTLVNTLRSKGLIEIMNKNDNQISLVLGV